MRGAERLPLSREGSRSLGAPQVLIWRDGSLGSSPRASFDNDLSRVRGEAYTLASEEAWQPFVTTFNFCVMPGLYPGSMPLPWFAGSPAMTRNLGEGTLKEGGAMMQSYVLWALLGMAGYSLMTLFVKSPSGAAARPPIWCWRCRPPSSRSSPFWWWRCGRTQAAAARDRAAAAAVGHRRRHRPDCSGELAVPRAVARAGQRSGADLRHVHRRRSAARRAGTGRSRCPGPKGWAWLPPWSAWC